jgi:histidine triad (HIT) family protein
MDYNESCLFCKIAAGKIPSKRVYNDDSLFAFHDINPVAPVHILIIPKRHIETLNHLEPADAEVMGKLMLLTKDLAKQFDIAASGYRVNLNCNADGGQTVFHLHAHVIGGKPMGWPPFPSSGSSLK